VVLVDAAGDRLLHTLQPYPGLVQTLNWKAVSSSQYTAAVAQADSAAVSHQGAASNDTDRAVAVCDPNTSGGGSQQRDVVGSALGNGNGSASDSNKSSIREGQMLDSSCSEATNSQHPVASSSTTPDVLKKVVGPSCAAQSNAEEDTAAADPGVDNSGMSWDDSRSLLSVAGQAGIILVWDCRHDYNL
jgi:hypothetical protein